MLRRAACSQAANVPPLGEAVSVSVYCVLPGPLPTWSARTTGKFPSDHVFLLSFIADVSCLAIKSKQLEATSAGLLPG